MTKLNKNSQ